VLLRWFESFPEELGWNSRRNVQTNRDGDRRRPHSVTSADADS
jgi:hypothetical protein